MTTPVEIQTRALHLLTGLGDTPDLVAGSLLRAGVTGVRQRTTACPIAVYLTGQLPEVEAAVSGEMITLWLPGPDLVEVVTPPAVAAFVALFDMGHFGDLLPKPPADHPFVGGYSGMVCVQMVELADGTGAECGRPASEHSAGGRS